MTAPRPSRPSTPRRRIHLVDDHPVIREGVTRWLNREPDLEVCCHSANATEALRQISRRRPDVLVTDLSLPGRSGLELIKDVRALHPRLPILVLSMHDDPLYARRALQAGASGYILKEAGGEDFVAAVRQVLRGGLYVSPPVAEKMLGTLNIPQPRGSANALAPLSDRELEIFELIGRGCDSRKISTQLHLSPRTVDVHRANIRRKLRVENSTELVQRAVHWVQMNQQGL